MLELFRASLTPIHTSATKLEKIGNWAGLIGLYLFSFFALLSIAGANLGLGLMIIGLMLSRQALRALFSQSITWFCLLIILYILLRAFWSIGEIAADQETQINQARDWIQLFLFFIPAWWLSQSTHRIRISVTLMFSGFALGMLTALDSETLLQALQGVRSGLHFGKPIILGFDCAAAILGLTALGMYRLDAQHDPSRRNLALNLGLIMIGTLFFTQGLIISQSRGVWLAILFALPMLFLTLRYAAPPRQRTPIRFRYPLLGLLLVMAMILAINWNTISQRITSESTEWSAIVNEGLDKAPLGSSSYRLHLWQFGLRKWLERPFFGWGPGTTHALVEAEDDINLQDPPGSSFDHLHNAYLEVVFQLGMFGIALVALISGLMIYKLMESYRRKRLSIYFLAFLMSNFTLIAIYSLTDFRHLHWNWRFYWLMIAGVTVAFGMILQSPARRSDHEHAD
ncbi:O-antigen ligase family protein [Candidatus Thiodiazotropha sp. CDECU1]|uniref:O-antigen ligase family protein n=1 Tax=Candidatus Thiodiazotropha sp. CDECU1 TaxID=3065865 RepID=UPI00292E1C3C|nr:O-antigen ligase family protein [Candidatus Thiodiazotropha sp. CDECU1]